MPLPSPFHVELVPRRFNQGMAVLVPAPVQISKLQTQNKPQPDAEEEEAGTGAGASVGLLEALFEARAGTGGPGGLPSGSRPWVILAETDPSGERYEQLLLYLLAEKLRCAGGAPRVQVPTRSALDEWTELAGRRLTFIPADRKFDEQRLLALLQGLIASQLSYVVISGTNEGVEKLNERICKELPPGVSLCRFGLGTSTREMLRPLLQWAFGHLTAVEWRADSLDNVATYLEAQLSEKLQDIKDRKVNPLHRKRSPGERESDEHYLTKLYVAWLYRNKDIEGGIEQPLPGEAAIPDVQIADDGLCYEIETLYGTGDPITKLNDTAKKYPSGQNSLREVRIVIPNFAALLYLPQLLRFERFLKRQDNRFSLWTLDLSQDDAREEKGLRPLRSVAAELRKLLQVSK